MFFIITDRGRWLSSILGSAWTCCECYASIVNGWFGRQGRWAFLGLSFWRQKPDTKGCHVVVVVIVVAAVVVVIVFVLVVLLCLLFLFCCCCCCCCCCCVFVILHVEKTSSGGLREERTDTGREFHREATWREKRVDEQGRCSALWVLHLVTRWEEFVVWIRKIGEKRERANTFTVDKTVDI